MAEQTFKAGDVVVLKSGSPKLTILWVTNDGTARVVWYNEATTKFSSDDLYHILLEKSE